MARSVFFSFHYQRDVFRVHQVKNHHIAKGNYALAGFFDGSLEEKAEASGAVYVKNLIDDGMSGSSVLCLLIGKETYKRRWIDYEILRAVGCGMGVFGIRIHRLKDTRPNAQADLEDGADYSGSNPLSFLKYVHRAGKLQPMIRYGSDWKNAPYQSAMSEVSAPPYLKSLGMLSGIFRRSTEIYLHNIFRVYDWVDDSGYLKFGSWVETAARQAGK